MGFGAVRARFLSAPIFLLAFAFLWALPSLAESEVYGGDEYQQFDQPKKNDENDYIRHRRLRRRQREEARNYRRIRQEGPIREGYGKAGCGLGASFFGSRKGPIQILAATSNASTFNQTFGISSGSSKCTGSEKERWLGAYLQVNGPKLQTQVAQGRGEVWETLPYLTGCSPSLKVLAVIQPHWKDISQSDSAIQARTILEVLRNSPEVVCES